MGHPPLKERKKWFMSEYCFIPDLNVCKISGDIIYKRHSKFVRADVQQHLAIELTIVVNFQPVTKLWHPPSPKWNK